MWDTFGEVSDKPCEVCNKTPTKIEPTFLYAICEDHYEIPPVIIMSIQ